MCRNSTGPLWEAVSASVHAQLAVEVTQELGPIRITHTLTSLLGFPSALPLAAPARGRLAPRAMGTSQRQHRASRDSTDLL